MSLHGKNFILNFKNSRLGRSMLVDDSELLSGATPINADSEGYIYILCDNCNRFMEYDSLKNMWICPKCEAKMKASSVYNEFDRENKDFLKTHPDFAD